MRKIVVTILGIVLITGLAACSQGSVPADTTAEEKTSQQQEIEETVEEPKASQDEANPLASKEYEPLEISESADFMSLYRDICNEYSAHVISFSDYLEKHSIEIELENKGFSDFDDYETAFDDFYRFMYGIMHSNSDNVPEEYKSAWSLFKTTIMTNKMNLDKLYPLKGQDLINGASDMLTYIQAGVGLINDAMPKSSGTSVEIGDTISLDFVEITIDEVNSSDTILPTDTSKGYSYKADVEKEKYFYISGTLKNLSGDSYDVEHIFAQMVFDDKYTYSGQMAACAWTSNFYGEYVKPLGSVKFYIFSSIPDELIDTYSQCTVSFGFQNNFDGTMFLSKDDCDYLYTLTATR